MRTHIPLLLSLVSIIKTTTKILNKDLLILVLLLFLEFLLVLEAIKRKRNTMEMLLNYKISCQLQTWAKRLI